MKKKSQLTVKGLFELLAVVIIITTFIYLGKQFGSGEAYFKIRSAKELALLANTVCGLPGNVQATFPADLSRYNIESADNTIYVYSPEYQSNTDPSRGQYKITKVGCIENTLIKKPKKLVVKKEGNSVKLI